MSDVLPEPHVDPEAEPTPAPETVPAPSGEVKELRLGLVCYGGVSLAIYMHGVTKEIHRAIRASVVAERGMGSREDALSEGAYRRLLGALETERNVHTRIVVDAVAGSSAGGINGIFLAKALAHDLSQDKLRDLWFEHGDLERIIRRPKGVPGRVLSQLVRPFRLGGKDAVPSERARERLFVAALGAREQPLLDGDEMSRRIYEALAGMTPVGEPNGPQLDSLMPPRHVLELAVTVTDHHGYARLLPLSDPTVVAEAQHRHLLQFHYRSDERDEFTAREDGALTLAARATSSLPLGFEPVHVRTFPGILPPGATKLEDITRFFRAYRLADASPEWAYLVDGGVLDNKPFGPVIRAIKERHAANEVERYLVYLEPDPKPPKPREEEPPRPTPIPAVLGALSGLPRSEPILDELHDILVRNERVRAVRSAIEANWVPVDQRMRRLVPNLDDPPADAEDPQLRQWSAKIHAEARSLGELTYPTYVRLKISSAIESFGGAACLVCDYVDESNQAFLVRAVLREWARRKGLFEHEGSPTQEQLSFVQRFDLEYAKRRLHFVIAGVSWLYRDLGREGYPSRAELDALKERLYQAVAKLEWLSSGRGFADEVLNELHTCFGEERLREHLAEHQFDTGSFLDAHADELDTLNAALGTFLDNELQGFAPELYRDLVQLTSGWAQTEQTREIRRDLLIRYLGFPIWDSMLYPLQALSDVAERDEIRLARLSPLDSSLLRPVQGDTKVLGAGLGHAYAFFSRRARENDYLWGRLDAAERIVRLLLTRTERRDGRYEVVPGQRHPDYRSWCAEAFQAVIDEDADDLPMIAEDIAALRRQVAEL